MREWILMICLISHYVVINIHWKWSPASFRPDLDIASAWVNKHSVFIEFQESGVTSASRVINFKQIALIQLHWSEFIKKGNFSDKMNNVVSHMNYGWAQCTLWYSAFELSWSVWQIFVASNYIELHQTRFVEFIKQLPFDGHRTMAVSIRHKAIMRCNQRSSRRMLFECRNIGKLQSKFDHVGVVGECSECSHWLVTDYQTTTSVWLTSLQTARTNYSDMRGCKFCNFSIFLYQ